MKPSSITASVSAMMLIALAACADTESSAVETTYDFGPVSMAVDGFVQESGVSGAGLIVVERDDGVVHEEYWGEFDADRTSLIASVTKMLSAGVLLRLDDQGLLDIDAPVSDVVDWGSGNPDITPAQLVSNSSGLVGIFPDPVFEPYICQFLPNFTLEDCASAIFTTAADDDQVVAPDTTFRYGGGQWQVAGAVAEAASGTSWSELIEQTYIEPCDLEAGSLGYSNYISQMGNGIDYPTEFTGDPATLVVTDNPNIEAGAYATPGVLAELLLMYLRDGECGDGQQVLSPDAIDQMTSDRVEMAYAGDAAPGVGYGMGWWIDRRDEVADASGAYGSVATLHIDDGYGYYLVLESNEETSRPIWESIAGPIRAAILDTRD